MMIEALLFDKDGTLFDFAATWNGWAAEVIRSLSGGQAALAQDLADAIQFDLKRCEFRPESLVIAGTNGEVAEALSPWVPQMTSAELEYKLALSAGQAELVAPVPLAPFLDELLAGGYVLGVMTNDAEHSALTQLKRAGVRDKFAFVAGSDSGFGAKPDPDPLLAFCEKTGVSAGSTAMVGDSLHDMIAGRAAGMSTIGVLTGPAQHGDLAPQADVVLDHIGYIPAWIGQSKNGSP